VFARDKNRCLMCPQPAADAHHIIERRRQSRYPCLLQ
jgi:hypothetical protein